MRIFACWAISKEWNCIWTSWKGGFIFWPKCGLWCNLHSLPSVETHEVICKVKHTDDQMWAPHYVLTVCTLCKRAHKDTILFGYNALLADCVKCLQMSHTMKHSCENCYCRFLNKLANFTRFEVFTVVLLRFQVFLEMMLCFWVIVLTIWKGYGAFIFKV